MKNGLLTIAIPTYNRVHHLRNMFETIINQKFDVDRVTILMIDNNSSDQTVELIQEFQKNLPFLELHRNSQNIGGAKNVLKCIQLCKSEYLWIVGDDDLLTPRSITRVLNILAMNTDTDFFATSLSIIDESEVEQYLKSFDHSDFRVTSRYSRWSKDRALIWQELIDPKVDEVYLGALMISVFRTSVAQSIVCQSDLDETCQFSKLITSYPHAYIFGSTMIDRKAYYIAEPLVSTVNWKKEWNDYTPLLITQRLNQLLDHYSNCGVDSNQIRRCRSHLFKHYRSVFWPIVFDKRLEIHQDFRFLVQVYRYWSYLEFWKAILKPKNFIKSLMR